MEKKEDLISRQAAIDAAETLLLSNDGIVERIITENNVNVFCSKIMALPSAQPEIIRCKDCKWFGEIGCAIEIVDDSDRPNENDFCSFAERREE